MGFIALMAKQALFSLVVKAIIWSFHDILLSIVRPRNFVLLILVSNELPAIICNGISLCFFVKNCKK